MERGTGRTTQQLRDAPRDAIFVWCNSGVHYPIALAKRLGRDDILVVRASYYKDGSTQGMNRPIVIDHAFK